MSGSDSLEDLSWSLEDDNSDDDTFSYHNSTSSQGHSGGGGNARGRAGSTSVYRDAASAERNTRAPLPLTAPSASSGKTPGGGSNTGAVKAGTTASSAPKMNGNGRPRPRANSLGGGGSSAPLTAPAVAPTKATVTATTTSAKATPKTTTTTTSTTAASGAIAAVAKTTPTYTAKAATEKASRRQEGGVAQRIAKNVTSGAGVHHPRLDTSSSSGDLARGPNGTAGSDGGPIDDRLNITGAGVDATLVNTGGTAAKDAPLSTAGHRVRADGVNTEPLPGGSSAPIEPLAGTLSEGAKKKGKKPKIVDMAIEEIKELKEPLNYLERKTLPRLVRFLGEGLMFVACLAWFRGVQSTQQELLTVEVVQHEGVAAYWVFAMILLFMTTVGTYFMCRGFLGFVDILRRGNGELMQDEIDDQRRRIYVAGVIVQWVADASQYAAVSSLNFAVLASIPPESPGLMWLYFVFCVLAAIAVMTLLHFWVGADKARRGELSIREETLSNQSYLVMSTSVTGTLGFLAGAGWTAAVLETLHTLLGYNNGYIAGASLTYSVVMVFAIPAVLYLIDCYHLARGGAVPREADILMKVGFSHANILPTKYHLVLVKTAWWIPVLGFHASILETLTACDLKADSVETIRPIVLFIFLVCFLAVSVIALLLAEYVLSKLEPADVKGVRAGELTIDTPSAQKAQLKRYIFYASINDMISKCLSRVNAKTFDSFSVLVMVALNFEGWSVFLYAFIVTFLVFCVIFWLARVLPESVVLSEGVLETGGAKVDYKAHRAKREAERRRLEMSMDELAPHPVLSDDDDGSDHGV